MLAAALTLLLGGGLAWGALGLVAGSLPVVVMQARAVVWVATRPRQLRSAHPARQAAGGLLLVLLCRGATGGGGAEGEQAPELRRKWRLARWRAVSRGAGLGHTVNSTPTALLDHHTAC